VENFYSDKTAHFYNMRFHAIFSIKVTLQSNRALFLISVVFRKKMSFSNRQLLEKIDH
jgi:hypothetical protein